MSEKEWVASMYANFQRFFVSRRAIVIGLGAAVVVTIGAVASYGNKPNEVGTFMRAKLDHSKKVLEGLALEDYPMIARESQELSLLSQATNWQVLQTAEYLEQSQDFRRTADALTEVAREKNLDGAALRYVELTMQCVNCHKYVRKTKLASIPVSADPVIGTTLPFGGNLAAR
jgi:cytochrome c556